MTIRTLLLGGAAAIVPAMAQAADAIVIAEPEPVEYVRVCDVYGSGFFYIPGTETCLRISGYVRYQMGATSDGGVFLVPGGVGGDTPNYFEYADGWNKTTRARLNVDARSDTEWGTLRAFLRFQANWGAPSDGPVRADQAWISLGGLRMGYSESAWSDSVHDLPVTGSHSDGGLWYGDQQRHFLQYNFGGDTGFFGTVSLEDDALAGDGYMPDVVGLVGYQQGWGGIWARIGFDEDRTNSFTPLLAPGQIGDSGFAASIGLQVNVPNAPGSSLRLIGYYADSDNIYGTGSAFGLGANALFPALGDAYGSAEWSVLASYYHQFTPKFGGSVGFQYFSDFYLPGTDIGTNVDGYIGEVSLVWVPVENFEIRAEGVYDKVDLVDGSVSGYLRFTRFF